MMGWAWILAAAAALWCIRSHVENEAPRSRWLPLVAPLLFAGLALLSVGPRTTFALFSLEGFSVPDPGPNAPALHIDGVRGREDARPESLRGPVLAAEALDPLGFEDAAGIAQPVSVRAQDGALELDAKRSPRAMVGFGRFDLTRVHPLDEVASVAILGANGEVLREWNVAAQRSGDRVTGYRITSPEGFDCDLRTEPLAWDLPGTGALQRLLGLTTLRTIALLDLYWYQPTGCTPRRIDLSDPMWPTTAPNGDIRTPVRSFFILDGPELGYLALLDPPERVRVTFAQPAAGARGAVSESRATSDAADAATARATLRKGGSRHRIHVLSPRIRIPTERLKLEGISDGDEAAADPDLPDRAYCEDGYGAAGDLSGRKLCKRVQVFLRRFTFDVDRRPGRLWVALEDPAVVTVEPYGEGDVPRAVLRSGGYLVDARAAGSEEAKSAPFPLSFPVSLENAQPFLAEIEVTREGCEDPDAGCFEVRSFRGDPATVPSGSVSRYGAEGGEEYLIRASLVGSLRFVAFLLLGLFALQVFVSARLDRKRTAAPLSAVVRVVLSALFVLLTARALYGMKLMVRYPHSAEGLATALLGAAFFGSALCAVAYVRTVRGALLCALPVAIGIGVVACLRYLGTVPLPFEDDPRLAVVVPGFLAFAGVLCVLATRGAGWISRISPAAATGALAAVAALRLGFALLGAERLVVPFFTVYWPAVCLLGGVAIYAFARTRSPIVGIGALLLFAVLAQFNDLGAVFVLGPAVLLAAVATLGAWVPSARAESGAPTPRAPTAHPLDLRRARTATGLAIALAGGSLALASGFVDARIPPDPTPVAWTIDTPGGDICPVPITTGGDLDLATYASRFDPEAWLSATSNRKARFFDLVHSGAANRVGTRAGTEVSEALAILRRYSAGPEPAFFGSGLLSADIRRYGRTEVDAQLVDGAPSVFVASEAGSAGLIGLLLLQSAVLIAVLRAHTGGGREHAHLTFWAVCAAATPTWATFLMVGGNLHWLPFTGQNTPLLAMISGADLIATPLLWAIALFATRLRHSTESPHA